MTTWNVKNEERKLTYENSAATVEFIDRKWNGSHRDFYAKPKMHVWTDATFSVVEHLENRHRRPHTVYAAAVRVELAGLLDFTGMRWSQKAGCSCGCSPAFFLQPQSVQINGELTRSFDVYVTLKGAPAVDETKPGRILASV